MSDSTKCFSDGSADSRGNIDEDVLEHSRGSAYESASIAHRATFIAQPHNPLGVMNQVEGECGINRFVYFFDYP